MIGGGSIFQGTLLAPGRKVEITQNHYYSFNSEGYEGTQAPETTIVDAMDAIIEKETNDSSWGGLWGQIYAGGTINFTESDISHQGCASPVPEPATFFMLGSVLIGLAGLRKKKQEEV